MSLAEIFNFGSGEIIVILGIVLMLIGARKLPDLARILGEGVRVRRRNEQSGHPVLVAATFALGALCLIVVLYELSK